MGPKAAIRPATGRLVACWYDSIDASNIAVVVALSMFGPVVQACSAAILKAVD